MDLLLQGSYWEGVYLEIKNFDIGLFGKDVAWIESKNLIHSRVLGR